MNVGDARRIHFIGIGGAGMSALARVLLERGQEVSGSDLQANEVTGSLESKGAVVSRGHAAAHVEGADLVVVSNAIAADNSEVQAARALGLPVVSRGEALAHMLSGTRSVVVAGTHGKTTTTSMIVTIMRKAGGDPTYLVGAELLGDAGNAHAGTDALAIAESDESDGSFLLLSPAVGVITNVDADHLDHWGSQELYRAGFRDFVGRIQSGGTLVVPGADVDLRNEAIEAGLATITFGPEGDVSALDIDDGRPGETAMTLVLPRDRFPLRLPVPGPHNVENALAAAAAALAVDVPPADIARGLEAYRGVERRFQMRATLAGRVVVDDYAHHPVEVRAALATAQAGNGEWDRVVAVFQPHRYSRTAVFASDFGSAFAAADRVVITDVYGAGEHPMAGISGKVIADAVCEQLPGRPVAYIPERTQLLDYLAITTRPGDLVLTLGAGDVTLLADELRDVLESR
ncbi:MAG: UDP-N-acetylmuramate--L-alanine ligase [Actinomycetota bacterium]